MTAAGIEQETVRRELARVLSSAGFARNERLSKFLEFIVGEHLKGNGTELKESVIALEVFGRPDYDPQQDSIVRTEASRLRARLTEYYLAEGKKDALVIELPKGGYNPLVRWAEGRVKSAKAHGMSFRPGFRTWLAVTASGIALVLAAGWWMGRRNAPVPIAVLPLINLNQDAANDYFADGLTAEIIRNLSIIDGLAVRSETSSFAFKGKPQIVREAAKKLQAEYILEGSVLRSGEQLRINADLVRASDDYPLWSAKYDRKTNDIFAVQEEISRGIVNSLRLKLGRGRRRYETSTEAYDIYLRALSLRNSGNLGPRGVARTIPVFEEAIAKDPSFAPAYAALAQAHVILSGNSNFDVQDEVPKLRAAAEKAIELDPLSAESYDALGAAYAREAQWEQAAKSFQRAIEIQPGRAESHARFAALYLLPLGRIDEAIAQLRIAERSDPLSPRIQLWLADALTDARRDNEAATACEKLLPDVANSEQCALRVRVLQGGANKVIQIYEADLAKPRRGVALGCAYARAGRREDAERVAASTAENPGAVSGAEIFACLGDKERVFEALNEHASDGPIRMGWVLNRVDRQQRGFLRGDARLVALRKKVGLPE